MNSEKKRTILRTLLLCIVIAVTTLLFVFRDNFQGLAHFGFGGIFILSILSNATLILPIPGIVLTTAMGAIFHPFWVAIAAGLGAAIGELTGYLAGYSGQIIVEESDKYRRLTEWMQHYGSITVLAMAIIPNPFFDLAGIAAGVLKMPVQQFLIWCGIGKIIKMLIFAYSGATLFKFFSIA